jgi:hypothetical protein
LLWERGLPTQRHQFGAASPIRSWHSDDKPRAHESAVTDATEASRSIKNTSTHDEQPNHRDHRGVRFEPRGSRAHQDDRLASDSFSRSKHSTTHKQTGRRPDGRSTEAQPSATSGSSERRSRYALPMDATRWPPLPAPVDAATSVNNATCGSQSEVSRGSTSVVESELSGRALASLQAYVETEAEAESGDGGVEDGSLLD